MLSVNDLPLQPIPSAQWQTEWDELMQDPWLCRKLDRNMRVAEHVKYVQENCPELETMRPGIVIDIGPGCGELLEIARHWGHLAYGIDAATGEGGMGNPYLRASQLMTMRQQSHVTYCGLLEAAAKNTRVLEGRVVFINARGSIEQALSDFMDGEPHHIHQCCRKLRWQETNETALLFAALMGAFARWLRDDGVLLIHANGSADDVWYDQVVRSAAQAAGLSLVVHEGFRLHKWVKRRTNNESTGHEV